MTVVAAALVHGWPLACSTRPRLLLRDGDDEVPAPVNDDSVDAATGLVLGHGHSVIDFAYFPLPGTPCDPATSVPHAARNVRWVPAIRLRNTWPRRLCRGFPSGAVQRHLAATAATSAADDPDVPSEFWLTIGEFVAAVEHVTVAPPKPVVVVVPDAAAGAPSDAAWGATLSYLASHGCLHPTVRDPSASACVCRRVLHSDGVARQWLLDARLAADAPPLHEYLLAKLAVLSRSVTCLLPPATS